LKKKLILDPLWITSGNYFDPEYFSYILLAANKQYKTELDQGDTGRLYEILFHILNLNNLAIDGTMFDSKLKRLKSNDRLTKIYKDLKTLYSIPVETLEVFKNANFVLVNMLIEYLTVQNELLKDLKFFFINPEIHKEDEIYIILNIVGKTYYQIWKLSKNSRSHFGFSFVKLKELEVSGSTEDIIRDELLKSDNSKLRSLNGKVNVSFAMIEKERDMEKVAIALKDTFLLNKGITKNNEFEFNIIDDFHKIIESERIMPFTLSNWYSN